MKEERLRFNGKRAWFVTPENKYGLSKFPLRNITDSNFTFLVRAKVDWRVMDNHVGIGKECGIVVKNGKHLGLRHDVHHLLHRPAANQTIGRRDYEPRGHRLLRRGNQHGVLYRQGSGQPRLRDHRFGSGLRLRRRSDLDRGCRSADCSRA